MREEKRSSDQTALQRTFLNDDHDEDGKTANFN